MTTINFPSNPTEGQKYTFGNFTYVYKSNRWTSAQSGATTGIDLFKASLADEGSTVTIAGVAAKDLVAQKDGVPVASVMWFPSRGMAAKGYIPADGQLLSRTVYASLWKMVETGKVPLTTDAAWLAAASNRGAFSLGDGSTTFRVPDYNGKSPDSVGSAFLRGDGKNAAAVGVVQGDASRAITGDVGWLVGGNPVDIVSPPFKIEEKSAEFRVYHSVNPDGGHFRRIGFDTALSTPTAPENRPVNVAGVWMIKAFSGVVNEGVVDAAQLATALAATESKLSIAEAQIAELKKVESVVIPLLGDPSRGDLTLVRSGNVVTFKAASHIPSMFDNDLRVFEIPERFRPVTSLMHTEFFTNVGNGGGNLGRLVLRGDHIVSFDLNITSVLFRSSGSWICGNGVVTFEEPINDAATLEEPEQGEFTTLEL